VKRAIDIVGSLIGLVIATPIIAVAMLVIRLDSPGPALFHQLRIGRNGQRFVLHKLRGMYVDAQERFPELYDYTYRADDIGDLRFHFAHDPRLTRVGRFIRATSIDELPNLWNVFVGEMSLVGPRPEIPELMVYYGERRDALLSVKPGITSLAKCTGRDELTFDQTLAREAEYVRNRSVRLDLKIMMRTAAVVLRRAGIA
jgi:lipopolysaccharide/colanic/teichoic acid biosynthesis glycosyltransferase